MIPPIPREILKVIFRLGSIESRIFKNMGRMKRRGRTRILDITSDAEENPSEKGPVRRKNHRHLHH